MQLTWKDSEYPEALRSLPDRPPLSLSGPLVSYGPVVAIVGSRQPSEDARAYARALARDLATAGATIVSGGALGIDAAAHEGALEAGGITWVVCGTGRNHVYPPQHRDFFERIAQSELSRMIWPFTDDVMNDSTTFRARNKVLVALSRAVVVVQARFASGSRNAARWARSLGRPLWVVPVAPWQPDAADFAGSMAELDRGALPLSNGLELFLSLGLLPPSSRAAGARPQIALPKKKVRPRRGPVPTPSKEGWSKHENVVFSSLSDDPAHVDRITRETGLGASVVATALLTLSLKNVVVEGPGGFFRRHNAG